MYPFTNYVIFGAVLVNDPGIVVEMINLFFDLHLKFIRRIQKESSQDLRAGFRGVRFDILAEDDTGRRIVIEMQMYHQGKLGFRFRYYQGMLDLSEKKIGDRSFDLSQTMIFMIVKEDIFGWNLPVYSMHMKEDHHPEMDLHLGMHWAILNISAPLDGLTEEQKAFILYLRGQQAESELSERIDRGVQLVNQVPDVQEEAMTFEEIVEAAAAEAAEAAAEKAAKEAAEKATKEAAEKAAKEAEELSAAHIISLMKKLDLSCEKAMDLLAIPEDQRILLSERIRKQLS